MDNKLSKKSLDELYLLWEKQVIEEGLKQVEEGKVKDGDQVLKKIKEKYNL